MAVFFTHIPFVENHTINVPPPERLQQHPLLFTTNSTDRTFFVWRLNSARPSHPGHSTILLRSDIPIFALIVWFTTNGMCMKNNTIYMWREQAITEWSWHVNSIVACCHSAKLCAYAARDFRSQHNQRNTTREVATVRIEVITLYCGCSQNCSCEFRLLQIVQACLNSLVCLQYFVLICFRQCTRRLIAICLKVDWLWIVRTNAWLCFHSCAVSKRFLYLGKPGCRTVDARNRKV